MAAEKLITDHLDLWTAAIKRKSSAGRRSSSKVELYGIKRLRELILELAVRGLLAPQDSNDEPASHLLKKIAAEKAKLVKAGNIKQGKPLPSIVVGDKHLPSGWSWTCMAELGEIAPRNVVEDDVIASFVPMPLISTSFDGRHAHEARTWTEIKKGYTQFADGDIAIAKITPCFENSKAAIFSGLHNGVGAGTTELHVVRPFGEFANRNYLLLYLKSPQFLLAGETKMTGSAGQKRVPTEFFSFNPLPLPPLAEQQRIVAKVDELMALCDLLEQQTDASLSAHQTLVETLLNALTSAADHVQFAGAWLRIAAHFDTLFTTEESIGQLKQTILQLAVMGKLVPQNPEDESATKAYSKALEIPVGYKRSNKQKIKGGAVSAKETGLSLPQGWVSKTVDQLYLTKHILDYEDGNHGSLYPRASDFTDEGVLFVTAAQISSYGEVAWNECSRLNDAYAAKLTKGWSTRGDVYFTHNATVGRTAIALDAPESDFLLGTSVTFYRVNSGSICPQYLYWYFSSQAWYRQAEEVMRQTTRNQVSITKQALFSITLPPLAEQHRIVRKLTELMALCDQLESRSSDAQATQIYLADALHKAAFSEA